MTDGMTSYDVIVVGLGAMGSSALYQLARRGLRVLGLEAFAPGHRLGSSHGESRVIRLAYYEHPNYVPLLRRAYELWEAVQRESGADLLHITGGLMIGPASGELVAGARGSAEQHRLDYEILSADEVRHRFPALHVGDDEVALWEPRAGYLRPERCIDTFVRLANAETHCETRVRSWRASGDGVELTTDTGRYVADQVVFTCGARISGVVGAESMPRVQAERIPLFWLRPSSPELFVEGRLPIYLWEVSSTDHFYGFPHVEWPGVKVARHHSGEVCDPDAVDRSVRAEDELRLRDVIGNRIPALNGPVESTLVCIYENSADHDFLIDRVAEHPNVIYAGGFSGHGFKFASVVGEILADLVTRGEATPDADFLRAARLTLTH
jgi:sarcosine oxidase